MSGRRGDRRWPPVALLFLGILAAAAAAPAATLELPRYRAVLEEILEQLRRGDDAAAATAARRLAADEVRLPNGETMATDRHLLAEIASAEIAATGAGAAASPAWRRRQAAHLELVIAELGAVAARDDPADAADPATLAAVRAAERRSGPAAGGELPGLDLATVDLEHPWLARLADFRRWLADRLADLWGWLRDLFAGEGGGAALDARQASLLVILLVAITLLAVLWSRRRRPPQPTAGRAAPQAAPAADADPRSREVEEWRRYAAELAAAGRRREAVRAWYHAVLVALYRRGLLHYRRGRTNWEYVAALPATIPWRPRFVELTRRFESAWYGHHDAVGDDLEGGRDAALDVLEALAAGREAA